MRRLIAPGLRLLAVLLAVSALGGCALPALGGAAPAPTQTPVYAPAGWTAYRGDHFTIAYPTGWTEHQTTSNGGQSSVIALTGPQPRDLIEVVETANVTQADVPAYCGAAGQTPLQLAGLRVTYQVVEGVHRTWTFVTDKQISYQLSTFDGDSSATMQAQSDAILATFRPDDHASGCP